LEPWWLFFPVYPGWDSKVRIALALTSLFLPYSGLPAVYVPTDFMGDLKQLQAYIPKKG